MNKKGFTLVELLAVIVIIGILTTLSVTSVITIRNNSLSDLVEAKIKDLESAAVLYGQDNSSLLTDSCTVDEVDYSYCLVVSVKYLIDEDYYEVSEYDDDNNPVLDNDLTNKTMLCNTFIIYRKNNMIYATLENDYSTDDSTCTCSLKTYKCN